MCPILFEISAVGSMMRLVFKPLTHVYNIITQRLKVNKNMESLQEEVVSVCQDKSLQTNPTVLDKTIQKIQCIFWNILLPAEIR